MTSAAQTAEPLQLTRAALPAAAIQIAIAVGMRLLCLLRNPIDTDEPQHLHLLWEWSQGSLAYRDFYDNHLPLFHMLFAPLAGVASASGLQLLLAGRLAMLPLAAAVIALSWVIADTLYGRRIAFLSALSVAVFPPLLLRGVEFRNDNLWVVLVLGAIALLVRRRDDAWTFGAGLLLGLALLVSIKTTTVAFGIAGAIVLVERRASLRRLAILAAAAMLPVGAVAAWFAERGALASLYLYAVRINGIVAVDPGRRVAGAVALLASIALSLLVAHRSGRDDRRFAAIVLLLSVGCCLAVSPLVSDRDFLAVAPLAVILGCAALFRVSAEWAPLLPAALALLTFCQGQLWRVPDPFLSRAIDEAAALAPPGEPVIDLKGELITHHRVPWVAFEQVGREMVRRGILHDTTAREAVASASHVAVPDSPLFPPAARDFLNRHYLPWGAVRVAGARVGRDGRFQLAVPGVYAVLDARGRRVGEPRPLQAATYHIEEACGGMVVWAPALERKRSPAASYVASAERPAAGRFPVPTP